MGILFAFAPFIAFALVDRALGSVDGLLAGAAISIALVLRDALSGRVPKILEIGSLVLFAGIALYVITIGANFSVMAVRLLVDGGLLLVVLISLAAGVPFTLQYAREQVPPEFWNAPEFKRTNVVITSVWAAAFAVITGADAVLVFMSEVPRQVGVLTIVAALVFATKFTGWYPKQKHTPASGS
ncbi:hypothetical protein DWF00_20900 [Bosea caraganae]|uniref:Intracellular septation protein A n=2 Tax=Bosea caraganae TaxID=2763117 RepID=A0A370KXG1_9HYPH|nr:hypothetical protein DWE98_28545 [Bosea caraganae]RDJ23829.1 hypothetical protein DWF00_20900 [Bosea caraganae]